MKFEDEIAAYIDEYGLVQNGINASSGNGLLFTAETIMVFVILGARNERMFKQFEDAYNRCQVQPGLLSRTPPGEPFSQDQEGPDDYIGAGVASYFLKTDLAAKILEYGRDQPFPYYNYNNIEPGKFSLYSWLGRQQNLICHLQFAAGEKPPMWRKLWWCAAIWDATRAEKGNQDAFILSWLCIKTMDGRSWLCQKVANYWWKKLLEKFPSGMEEVFREYFGSAGPIPIIRWVGTGK